MHAPGAPTEGFSRAVAVLTRPDLETVLKVAAANGIELLGPVNA